MAEHSPLGASGSYRWMECPGSVNLGAGIVDEESDFTAQGIAAHHLAAAVLGQGEYADTWQWVGTRVSSNGTFCPPLAKGYNEFEGLLIDKEMADAVAVYVAAVRTAHPNINASNTFIEHHFRCPSIHRFFWGTSDFCHLEPKVLHVWDYKHGAGIVVEVTNNPQLKYYAAGVLESMQLWDKVETVKLYIAQPRGWHGDGPIRTWSISVSELLEWLDKELVPAMDKALISTDTKSGEHCRFCPARGRQCPQIASDLLELEGMLMTKFDEKKGAEPWTNEEIGRWLQLEQVARIAFKAISAEGFKRMNGGGKIPGQKLATARTFRAWKENAEPALKAKFGDAAYEVKLKSPAQIEAMPEGEALTARYSYKPPGGLTMVPESDKRREVSRDTKAMFQALADKKKGT